MNPIITRTLTGIVYIAAIVGAIMAGTMWFAVLLALLLIPSAYELQRMTTGDTAARPTQMIDIITSELIILTGMTTGTNTTYIIVLTILMMLIRAITQLYIKSENPIKAFGTSALTQLYLAAPLALLGWLYMQSPAIVLGVFIMIWLNDTGAFCVGSLIGRHKLFERISPKKSWEGFVGGLIFSIAAGAAYRYWFAEQFAVDGTQLSMAVLMCMGAIVSVAGTYGDLVESYLKRTAGIKDSGNLLPGHGGMLDRIDSLLLAAPATAALIMIITL